MSSNRSDKHFEHSVERVASILIYRFLEWFAIVPILQRNQTKYRGQICTDNRVDYWKSSPLGVYGRHNLDWGRRYILEHVHFSKTCGPSRLRIRYVVSWLFSSSQRTLPAEEVRDILVQGGMYLSFEGSGEETKAVQTAEDRHIVKAQFIIACRAHPYQLRPSHVSSIDLSTCTSLTVAQF